MKNSCLIIYSLEHFQGWARERIFHCFVSPVLCMLTLPLRFHLSCNVSLSPHSSSCRSPQDLVLLLFDPLRTPARLCCFIQHMARAHSPFSFFSFSYFCCFPISLSHLALLPNANLNTNQYFRILSPPGEITPPCRQSLAQMPGHSWPAARSGQLFICS